MSSSVVAFLPLLLTLNAARGRTLPGDPPGSKIENNANVDFPAAIGPSAIKLKPAAGPVSAGAVRLGQGDDYVAGAAAGAKSVKDRKGGKKGGKAQGVKRQVKFYVVLPKSKSKKGKASPKQSGTGVPVGPPPQGVPLPAPNNPVPDNGAGHWGGPNQANAAIGANGQWGDGPHGGAQGGAPQGGGGNQQGGAQGGNWGGGNGIGQGGGGGHHHGELRAKKKKGGGGAVIKDRAAAGPNPTPRGEPA